MIRTVLLALGLMTQSTPAQSPIAPIAPVEHGDHRAEWDAYLRTERQLAIGRLQAYSDAGMFPQNPDVPGYSHQFVDSNGVPCAVANLILQSGHADLVTDVAQRKNDLLVGTVKSGPIAEWILTSGLTQEELAIIQVPDWEPYAMPIQPVPTPRPDVDLAEVQRVQAHLNATITVLYADTESSIDEELHRLGKRIDQAPPSNSTGLVFASTLPGLSLAAPSTASWTSASPDGVDHRAEWDAYLRTQREIGMAHLSDYAAAGVFPQNPGVPGFSHQFLDANGTPCAVANLIVTSGHADLVAHTAKVKNDTLIAEVDAGDLYAWTLTSGFTREELAIIQEPGWEGLVTEPIGSPTEIAEVARIQGHLYATMTLLQTDTDSAIAKALERLGDRVNEAPPTTSVSAL